MRRHTPNASHMNGSLISGEPSDRDLHEIVWQVELWLPSCPGRHNQADVPGQFSQRHKVVDETPFLRGTGGRCYDGVVCGIDDNHEEGILALRGYHFSSLFQPS